ncbi:hypothetical protein [Dyella acidiphila]|uniref:Uncharacterized protein n=1 Tax=Dyella acidiphila TaxID=2775866 RepID=A0ABR9G581_9GAMM|nr:hypothetical protein [Dyella acidiphila]MBE1159206.1 hypothetical protein [Dyella acidiphila]
MVAIDWRALAERRLSRLTEVEHDIAVARDRLDYFQANYRTLLQQSEERLRQIQALERELDELRTARARARGALRRWILALPQRAKGLIRAMLRVALRLPLARPLARRLARLFPGLGNRLRASVNASQPTP